MTTRMHPIRDTIPLSEARRIINDGVEALRRVEQVTLSDAHDRVVAHDIVSPVDCHSFLTLLKGEGSKGTATYKDT